MPVARVIQVEESQKQISKALKTIICYNKVVFVTCGLTFVRSCKYRLRKR